ncbi:hypothetical protein Mnod_3577 [Methylobacterium nodulans ORS 2060]|uniref:Uncharacterized protein n=2 Tax=Methylobacterium nodulans TaxID=114616 RepID=B8INX0_METNO|nr:hypothetical protein Mnod_3577 [Methylobacterium nodulans ORS 2060]
MSADQLSLYLDLEEGQKADLEVAARAAIALTATVREIAAFIDPFSDVKLELIDSSEGSLFLNTKVRFLSAAGPKEMTLYAVLFVCLTWIGTSAVGFVVEKIEDHVWEQAFGKDFAKLSDDDKKDIADLVARAIEANAGKKPSERLYAELSQDPAVKGVAVTKDRNKKPSSIVPRSEFASRSGGAVRNERVIQRRTTRGIRKVILVSPVLVPGKRRWKFRIGKEEFGAPVHDTQFVDAVLSGKFPIVMKSNVEMTVDLEVTEELNDGHWEAMDYNVWRVLGAPVQFQGEQTSFPLDKK